MSTARCPPQRSLWDACPKPTLCRNRRLFCGRRRGLYDGCLVDDFSLLSWSASLSSPRGEGSTTASRRAPGRDPGLGAEPARSVGGLITYIEPCYLVTALWAKGLNITWSSTGVHAGANQHLTAWSQYHRVLVRDRLFWFYLDETFWFCFIEIILIIIQLRVAVLSRYLEWLQNTLNIEPWMR